MPAIPTWTPTPDDAGRKPNPSEDDVGYTAPGYDPLKDPESQESIQQREADELADSLRKSSRRHSN
jgi:hypothetical protein